MQKKLGNQAHGIEHGISSKEEKSVDQIDWRTILTLAQVGDNNYDILLQTIGNEEDPNIFIGAKPKFQQLFLQTVLCDTLVDFVDPIMKSCSMLNEGRLNVGSLSVTQKLQLNMITPSAVNPKEAWNIMVALLEPQETTQANWARGIVHKTRDIPPDAKVDVQYLLHVLEVHSVPCDETYHEYGRYPPLSLVLTTAVVELMKLGKKVMVVQQPDVAVIKKVGIQPRSDYRETTVSP